MFLYTEPKGWNPMKESESRHCEMFFFTKQVALILSIQTDGAPWSLLGMKTFTSLCHCGTQQTLWGALVTGGL